MAVLQFMCSGCLIDVECLFLEACGHLYNGPSQAGITEIAGIISASRGVQGVGDLIDVRSTFDQRTHVGRDGGNALSTHLPVGSVEGSGLFSA